MNEIERESRIADLRARRDARGAIDPLNRLRAHVAKGEAIAAIEPSHGAHGAIRVGDFQAVWAKESDSDSWYIFHNGDCVAGPLSRASAIEYMGRGAWRDISGNDRLSEYQSNLGGMIMTLFYAIAPGFGPYAVSIRAADEGGARRQYAAFLGRARCPNGTQVWKG